MVSSDAQSKPTFAYAIEDDVDKRNDDLPNAIQGEEMSQDVIIFAHQRLRVLNPLLQRSQIDQVAVQLRVDLFIGGNILLDQRDIIVRGMPVIAQRDGEARTERSLDEPPRAVRVLRRGDHLQGVFVLDEGDGLLLRRDHLHHLLQSLLRVGNVLLRDRLDKDDSSSLGTMSAPHSCFSSLTTVSVFFSATT